MSDALCVDCCAPISLCGHALARLLEPERWYMAGVTEELRAENARYRAAIAEALGQDSIRPCHKVLRDALAVEVR